MKTTIRSLALVGGCGLSLLAFPQTGRSQGFYLNANAGVALAQDVDLDRFIVSTPGAKLKLDPGPQFSVAGGYHFNSWLAVQAETGFMVNRVDNLNNDGDDYYDFDDDDYDDDDSYLSHMPLLIDVVVRYDRPDCKWVPYAGVGAGGDVSVLSLDHVRAPDGSTVDGTSSEFVFAWQAFAGLRYKFHRNMSIGGGYKFYSANGATWDVDNTAGEIKTGTAQVHSLVVDFTWTF